MYPQSYFTNDKPMPKLGTCFVAMPFAPKFENVFAAIKAALDTDLALTCIRTKELSGGGNIIQDILRGLGESEFVIVDVTGGNPNVFYELGIAHMCKEVSKVLLLAQKLEAIPFDLRHFRHIVYSASAAGLASLREELRKQVSAVGEGIYRLAVNEQGKGALPEKVMGSDYCLYDFEIRDSFPGGNGAKLSLRVTQHVMAQTRQATVLFDNGMGLRVGERRPIPNTIWALCLERVSQNRAVFRIEEPAPIQPAPRRTAPRKPTAASKKKAPRTNRHS